MWNMNGVIEWMVDAGPISTSFFTRSESFMAK